MIFPWLSFGLDYVTWLLDSRRARQQNLASWADWWCWAHLRKRLTGNPSSSIFCRCETKWGIERKAPKDQELDGWRKRAIISGSLWQRSHKQNFHKGLNLKSVWNTAFWTVVEEDSVLQGGGHERGRKKGQESAREACLTRRTLRIDFLSWVKNCLPAG